MSSGIMLDAELIVDSISFTSPGWTKHFPVSAALIRPSLLVSAASIQVVNPEQVVFPGPAQRAVGSMAQLTFPRAVFLMQGATPLLDGTPHVDLE
jgi:hypothetical protein